jgi:phosphatidylglycerol lysyltransferase
VSAIGLPNRTKKGVVTVLLSLFAFLSGASLLFSGAMPATAGRLAALARLFPIGVIEASHFTGSVVGAALLVLSHGLARRLDAAYLLAVAAITLGIVTSLLEGVGYEEALALTIVLIVLWRARTAFDRRAAFFDARFSPAWLLAIAGVLAASVWIGMFAFRHVEYSHELWWQFGVDKQASRFLRGSVGAAVFLLLAALARLLAPAIHEVAEPSPADLDTVSAIIERQPWTFPNLAFLRDKAVLFDDERQGFVMYGVQRRTWVALGDPVGPSDRVRELIRGFLEKCDDFGGVPVFYEVRKDYLDCYTDFGLTFVKLGEEARVDLTSFTLAGGHWMKHRQNLRRLEKAGVTFRVIGRDDAAAIIERLRTVSNEWLAAKPGGEKGFSLGCFSIDYLSRFDIAVMERDGEIIAFANLWAGPQQIELATDLIRHCHSAPPETMEALLLNVMAWGKSRGYRWFSLGVAPLSGLERSTVAPLWSRVGSFLYTHGEAFYRFRGLRAFKQKFRPEWEPRYLVYPGGLGLPRIVADLSALIAGGYSKLVLK